VFQAIRRLFGSAPLSEASLRGPKPEAFFRTLAGGDILLLSCSLPEGLDPEGLTQEAFLARVRQAAQELSTKESFTPFVYEREGRRAMPFFTEQAHAGAFAAWLTKERKRIFPFETLVVRGAVLAGVLPLCDVLVMNDRSAQEVVFSEAERAAVQRLSP
jgi:hypothetical protein